MYQWAGIFKQWIFISTGHISTSPYRFLIPEGIYGWGGFKLQYNHRTKSFLKYDQRKLFHICFMRKCEHWPKYNLEWSFSHLFSNHWYAYILDYIPITCKYIPISITIVQQYRRMQSYSSISTLIGIPLHWQQNK